MKIELQQPGAVFDMEGAAEYLEMTYRAIKWHVYVSQQLIPDDHAGKVHPCFTRETLDAFAATRRKRGRPRKS